MTRRNPVPACFLALAVLVHTACGEPTANGGAASALLVRADLSATTTALVVVEVASPDLPASLVFNVPISGRMASGSITVPSGSARAFTMRAYDPGGLETHRGSAVLDVRPGVQATISIVLKPLNGEVAIVATLASFVVSLTPSMSVVTVGETVNLVALVQDADGVVVTDPVLWGTLSPTVATVTSTGPLTARVTTTGRGAATIVASYGGAAGSATVVASPASTAEFKLVASGLNLPLYVAAPPGDTLRVFVVQQDGRIRVIRRDTLLSTLFLDVSDLITLGDERGLLSMAFHPSYGSNGRFFVYYTGLNGDIKVARYRESPDNPNVADGTAGEVLLSIPHSTFVNHNGGLLTFGPDGYLYIGIGDGGSGGDPFGNGQDSTTLLGKILRIDVNGAGPYTIPPGNPFVDQPPAAPEVWAYGLRNPWRFSFDRLTGDLYIADVGEVSWEEIDFAASGDAGGRNYGWNTMEGMHCYNPSNGCVVTGRVLPVYEYSHLLGCSIIGGYVYRGTLLPAFYGRYIFADLCSGWVKSLEMQGGVASDVLDHTPQLGVYSSVTSFGQDGRGEIYMTVGDGRVYRLAPQ